ncbi:hypothetical protein Ahy_B01g054841 [Arachis hypogaea]|uniref:Aminotransferase-like plant mobile domain-containing protein n=1 Tax=Arachis hypogaea TaxID=3818 RepID=A0A445AUD9_ARAHY|nr:hypothetical protein Ahy_B01g054841 [Arachis hypogaea]
MEDDLDCIYWLDEIVHIAVHPMYYKMKRQHVIPVDDRIIPYLQMIELYYLARLKNHRFRSDEQLDTDEDTVKRYARAYVMILLSTQLFGDKSSTHLHIQWLPYVARQEDMDRYS